ncbi:hypothetical protein DPMN_010389 [Dreissena polymorpha]|uniref:Uncharacterized protein n=1 Tax=Dreissena polymorpha TaxID=45954 RepID=A0A9D4N326_DREPO|nr:hypothetical protein DPMN_010389 [Dreissena polymorpha]
MYVSNEEQTWLRTIISLSLIETKAEEQLDRGAQPTPTVQHCHSERHLEARRVQGHSLQVLEELLEEGTIEQKWQNVKEAVTSTCQEVLGPKSYTLKEWMSAETLQKVEERR